ncbi:protein LTV1 homolog [Contarinia nasturtii]|uniref:protein LTV1 homolog n=1 Tax=Contarinia nasturtii TaxID=265458 RepID=UPI0012D3B72D|nr:protein LTV1 homolog [Contarinia nasturtii]
MPKAKRRFIDKKNAVTFHLVHRSQQDPLIADETAPQHVLLESNQTTQNSQKKETPEEREKRKEEERKYGIFFDDEYDYLQHLRTKEENNELHCEYIPPVNLKIKSNENNESKAKSVGFTLPSSVFASEFEEDEGLLRKIAPHLGPRPDLEPEIVAALDDDFDFENADNVLEDNFMELAMGDEGDGADFDGDYSDIGSDFDDHSFNNDEEDCDRLAPLRGRRMYNFDSEENKSRFTEYSMSSSVIRRNEQLTLLDDRFEKFYENYDEPEIGALDMEEIEGQVEMSGDLLNQCMSELKRDVNDLPYDKKWDEQRIKKLFEEESSEEEMIEIEITEDEPDGKRWDCKSVLSLNSNAYNHPKLISEPRRRKGSKIVINPKTGVPNNVFNGENTQLTLKSIAKFNTENVKNESKAGPKSLCDQSVLSTLSVLSIRPKDESLEEKRQRKRLLKEYRTERRIEKKANQDAFKEEKKRQIQVSLNNRNNVQGNRIL